MSGTDNGVPTMVSVRINFASYQSICQHGLLVWGSVKDNFLKFLQSNQNNVLRIILNKKYLVDSSKINYSNFGVLPIRYLYKQFLILFIITNLKSMYFLILSS